MSWKTLLELAKDGSADEIRAFLSSGSVAVDAEEPGSGVTALCVAADAGNFATAKVLVEMGAKFKEPCTENGNSPAHFAARQGHVNILKIFHESGMDMFSIRNSAVRSLAMKFIVSNFSFC
jgi:ankyrin repeat protein